MSAHDPKQTDNKCQEWLNYAPTMPRGNAPPTTSPVRRLPAWGIGIRRLRLDSPKEAKDPVEYYTGSGLALGLAFGSAFGAAQGDTGTGLGLGLTLGLGLAPPLASASRRGGKRKVQMRVLESRIHRARMFRQSG